MKITKYEPGVANWTDLASPDVPASVRFYGALFGWEGQVAPMPESEEGYVYTMFHQGDAAVAGLGPIMDASQPPAWSVYFATDDADATAARVEASGGKVVMAPMDVMDQGRLAMFMDPGGAVFGVWQKNAFVGSGIKEEPVSMSWVELMTRDADAAVQFYGSVFGWTTQSFDMGGMPYLVARVGEKSTAGVAPMVGDQWPAEIPSHWMVYFEVADCDETVAKVQELGGTLSVPATDIPDVGRFAVAADPGGAAFAVIKSVPVQA
jgi:predicted enzyme related to lactoylglutathione lyase